MLSKILRTKTGLQAFSADADPNASAPASSLTAQIPALNYEASGGSATRSVRFSAVFIDAVPAEEPLSTVTATIWLKDSRDDKWINVGTLTTLAHRESVVITNIGEGTVFVQVTAVSVTDAVQVQVIGAPIAEGS